MEALEEEMEVDEHLDKVLNDEDKEQEEEQKEKDPEEVLGSKMEEVKLATEPLLLPPPLSSSIDQHPPLIYSSPLQSLLGNY